MTEDNHTLGDEEKVEIWQELKMHKPIELMSEEEKARFDKDVQSALNDVETMRQIRAFFGDPYG